jgi:pimeloyl-ACP methyl ester carboxylesterase
MEKLALANVKRWFLADNVRTENGRQVLRKVQENNFDAFKKGTNALIHLDLEPKLPSCQVSRLFVSGACDSMLPVEMARYAKLMPTGVGSFATVPDAGDLPMVENPLGFLEKVATFVGFAK